MDATALTDLLASADPVIHAVLRRKLRASLRPDDGREHNLDALDLLGDIRLKLVRKFEEEGAEVASLSSYAATAAYNVCNDYLRAKYPARTRLRNAVRRVLERSGTHAVWRSPQRGEWLCGLAGWTAMAPVPDPALPPMPHANADSAAGLLRMAVLALDHASGPVELDDLVEWIGRQTGIEETRVVGLEAEGDEQLYQPVTAEPDAESRWLASERMRLLWGAIQQLLPWHRAAYLLNLRDGELDAFPYYGAASVAEIERSLSLGVDQLDRLMVACGVPSGTPAHLGFAACWTRLPVDDNVVASVLGVGRNQVIGYRNKAIERLRRILQPMGISGRG